MPQHPDRVLRLQGASNFRDLGGYAGHGGRPLRWRRLFRAEHLTGLTDTDRAVLAQLGVTRAVDFRGQAERAATPYQWPGITPHALPIEPTVVQRMQDMVAAGETLTVPVVQALMKALYHALVTEQAPRFAELFALLLQDDAPLPTSGTPPEVLAVLWRVEEDFLNTALDAIDAQDGGMAGFLRQRIGLDAAALDLLAARYLAPA